MHSSRSLASAIRGGASRHAASSVIGVSSATDVIAVSASRINARTKRGVSLTVFSIPAVIFPQMFDRDVLGQTQREAMIVGQLGRVSLTHSDAIGDGSETNGEVRSEATDLIGDFDYFVSTVHYS